MNRSNLNECNGNTVLVNRHGKETMARLDTTLFPGRPCLTFPEVGVWQNVEPHMLTDEDIQALDLDAGSKLIRSRLRL